MSIGKPDTLLLSRSLFGLICLSATVWVGCSDDIEEVEADVIYIDDATLEDVYYHQVRYDRPTILVFSNLTVATNSVYFHQCVNIKEVQLPKLVSVGGSDAINPYLYFHQNEGLEKVKAPELTTVYGYVYFYGNSALDLSTGICGVADIYPRGEPAQIDCSDPYVHITGNANNNGCFDAAVHTCN